MPTSTSTLTRQDWRSACSSDADTPKRYFRLSSDCFLVEGEDDAVLYDVHGRRVLLLETRANELIRRCEANEPLDELGPNEETLLQTLEAEGLGAFDAEPAYVDKLLLRRPVEWKGWSIEPPRYYRFDWSITDECDVDCHFCGQSEQTLVWQACQTCVRGRKSTERWKAASNVELIDQLAGLGFRVLHIRGGDPLLAWATLTEIVDAVRHHPPLSLIVTTPGTGRSPADLVTLARDGAVRFNIVLFGLGPMGSRESTAGRSLLEIQLSVVDALLEAQIPIFLTLLLTPDLRPQLDETLKLILQRWGGIPSVAEVRPRAEVNENPRLHQIRAGVKPLTPWGSVEEFFLRIRNNTCNAGNVELGTDGKVRPCAGIDRVCGDLASDAPLSALSTPELFQAWQLNKSSIEPCGVCPMRFACADCTVFELAGADDSRWKYAYCPYNPRRDDSHAHMQSWSPGEFVSVLGLDACSTTTPR